jgi:teichuronic acid biosynthesis glycosyltransferase TuaC
MLGHLTLMRRLYRRADHALVNSLQGAELLADLGLERSRITVLPQGVSDERIAPRRAPEAIRRELGLETGSPLVVAVGRANHIKDWPNLLQAMALVWGAEPLCTLALVGPTSDEMADAGAPLPDRAKALGWRGHAADFMRAADVVAISSWTEGHSNVAGEALRVGAPVATTDAGAHPPIVADAGGKVVPIRRPELLAQAIVELLRDPPPAERVREVARRRLNVDAGVDVTRRTYEELLASRGRPSASHHRSTTASKS